MNISKNQLNLMKNVLNDALCGKIENKLEGICINLGHKVAWKSIQSIIEKSCSGWIHSSSDKLYPISHNTSANPSEAYKYCTDMWIDEYGRRRLELCQRMIDVIDIELEKV